MTTQRQITRTRRSSHRTRALPPVKPKNETPQQTVLILDCSGSAAEEDIKPTRLDAEKASAIEFSKERALRSPRDEIAIVSYDTRATRECAMESVQRLSVITRAITGITLGAFTAMGCALKEAERAFPSYSPRGPLFAFCRWLSDAPATIPHEFMRRIILLTDGEHNHGTHPTPIAMRLKRAGVHIDCIGIGGDSSAVNESLLRTIASTDATTGEPC